MLQVRVLPDAPDSIAVAGKLPPTFFACEEREVCTQNPNAALRLRELSAESGRGERIGSHACGNLSPNLPLLSVRNCRPVLSTSGT